MQMFGFGLEDPRENRQTTSNHLYSPCIRPDVHSTWQHASTDYVITGSRLLPSASSFEACYARATEIVSMAIHHEWEVSKETFYAFSYFYDLAVDAEIIPHVAGGQTQVGLFKRRAREICDASGNNKTQHLHKPFLCMDLSYLSALLIEGFGFKEKQSLVLQKKINGVETSWALGAMFHMLNTFHNTSQVQLVTSRGDSRSNGIF